MINCYVPKSFLENLTRSEENSIKLSNYEIGNIPYYSPFSSKDPLIGSRLANFGLYSFPDDYFSPSDKPDKNGFFINPLLQSLKYEIIPVKIEDDLSNCNQHITIIATEEDPDIIDHIYNMDQHGLANGIRRIFYETLKYFPKKKNFGVLKNKDCSTDEKDGIVLFKSDDELFFYKILSKSLFSEFNYFFKSKYGEKVVLPEILYKKSTSLLEVLESIESGGEFIHFITKIYSGLKSLSELYMYNITSVFEEKDTIKNIFTLSISSDINKTSCRYLIHLSSDFFEELKKKCKIFNFKYNNIQNESLTVRDDSTKLTYSLEYNSLTEILTDCMEEDQLNLYLPTIVETPTVVRNTVLERYFTNCRESYKDKNVIITATDKNESYIVRQRTTNVGVSITYIDEFTIITGVDFGIFRECFFFPGEKPKELEKADPDIVFSRLVCESYSSEELSIRPDNWLYKIICGSLFDTRSKDKFFSWKGNTFFPDIFGQKRLNCLINSTAMLDWLSVNGYRHFVNAIQLYKCVVKGDMDGLKELASNERIESLLATYYSTCRSIFPCMSSISNLYGEFYRNIYRYSSEILEFFRADETDRCSIIMIDNYVDCYDKKEVKLTSLITKNTSSAMTHENYLINYIYSSDAKIYINIDVDDEIDEKFFVHYYPQFFNEFKRNLLANLSTNLGGNFNDITITHSDKLKSYLQKIQ